MIGFGDFERFFDQEIDNEYEERRIKEKINNIVDKLSEEDLFFLMEILKSTVRM